MEKQLTAVNWLVLELRKPFSNEYIDKIIEQAKAFEKQQIINAHLIGLITSLETEATKQATEYYNEKYNKND